MGQLFDKAGGLTVPNSAISDPDTGQTQAVNPKLFSQIRDQGALDRSAQSIAPQPAAPNMSMGPGGQPSFSTPDNTPQTYKPPQPFTPSFGQAATTGAQPGGVNALSPQLSKLGKLGVLLTQGVQGALAGRAANEEATVASGGRRSGGIGMAMEAGYSMPFLRSLQQQKVQQGQAEIEATQAKTGQTEAQTNLLGTSTPVTMPDGRQILIPNSQLGQYLKGGAAAQTSADSRETVQGMKGATAMSVEQMKFAIQNGQVARVEDGLDPQSGQPAKIAYDRMGRRMGVLPGSLPSSAYLPKASDTVEYKEDENGNIISLPKRTTTQPQIPGLGGAAALPRFLGGGGAASGAGTAAGGGPRVVARGKVVGMAVGTDPQGNQVAGTPEELRGAGVTAFTKLDAGEAAKVNTARQMTSPNGLFGLIDKDLARFQPGELEALGPRWNEFLAAKVGTMPSIPVDPNDPSKGTKQDTRYVDLRTHVNGLLSTALMQAHVGARGGERMMEHFEDIANAGKMSLPTLKAAIGAEREYVQEKAMRPVAQGQATPAADPFAQFGGKAR
jgi:hypothetical protein